MQSPERRFAELAGILGVARDIMGVARDMLLLRVPALHRRWLLIISHLVCSVSRLLTKCLMCVSNATAKIPATVSFHRGISLSIDLTRSAKKSACDYPRERTYTYTELDAARHVLRGKVAIFPCCEDSKKERARSAWWRVAPRQKGAVGAAGGA